MEKPLFTYRTLEVGQELPPMEVHLTPDLQGRYLLATEDTNPWYWKESPFGGPIALGVILEDAVLGLQRRHFRVPLGHIHARQETEYLRPIPLGSRVRLVGRVAEKYEKRGRKYVVVEVTVLDEEGQPAMRMRLHDMIEDDRIRAANPDLFPQEGGA